MTPETYPTCPHDLRPGTNVCLHCRREERLRSRARSRKLAVRYVGLGAVAIVGAVAVVAGFGAAQDWRSTRASARAEAPASRGIPSLAAAQPPVTASTDAAVQEVSDSTADIVESAAVAAPAHAPAPAATLASAGRTERAPFAPVIRDGRTELRDGMYAERSGDTVRVHFDTELGRTRRPEKFENVIRVTLPAVFGSDARALMARTAPGEIARAGDLFQELPNTGVRLALADGWSLLLHPETRAGRDGPLVVAYRATVAR